MRIAYVCLPLTHVFVANIAAKAPTVTPDRGVGGWTKVFESLIVVHPVFRTSMAIFCSAQSM